MTISEKETSGDTPAEIWKRRLAGRMPADWAEGIDHFETEILLKKQGKIEDKVFAETRLRRGAYGQRYDNGFRHDGASQRAISYPAAATKGPNTLWDAPGMQRIKIPFGGMTTEQMDVIADLSEEYADSICHVTTRQDFQLHYVSIDDTPSMFRRLAAVGITTLEACGNSVRNVTACPVAGVCRDESFDVTPYARAAFRYLLGHPDVQDFGRKFKIAFSGCRQHPCGLTSMHDLGFIAVKRTESGRERRGFEMVVGGGLGSDPYKAKVFAEFVPEEEFLALTQAVCRVYARLGEKKKRGRARIKFLVSDLGIEKFRELVVEERAKLPKDARWTDFLSQLSETDESPLRSPQERERTPGEGGNEYEYWLSTNVAPQRQPGYAVVSVTLPLGDITANQMRGLADIARKFVKNTVRTTVEQNIILRWVSQSDVPAVYAALKSIDLAEPGAGTIVDVTACPGTDTCKLGVSSSRGLAGVLRTRLAEKSMQLDEAIRGLRIKISGCFNSCGQHHIADIGFYGTSRNVRDFVVPHFQLVLGGKSKENAASYGLAMGNIPSKSVPATVDRLTDLYARGRQAGESFQAFIARLGKTEIKKALADLAEVPPREKDASYYTDWGDVREYSTKDKGMGECAGEVVSLTEFGLKAADREVFEAQVLLDQGEPQKAAETAYRAMMHAAQALIKKYNIDISEDPEAVVKEFRSRFYDTQIFHDPYAGPKFAAYYFRAHERRTGVFDAEKSHHLVEEAQLFIEAAYSCNIRMSMAQASSNAVLNA
ncbi:nitrite/sulfite reductase [bacterium]|nr:nitrite/sulfite reductase [bacterium]